MSPQLKRYPRRVRGKLSSLKKGRRKSSMAAKVVDAWAFNSLRFMPNFLPKSIALKAELGSFGF